MLADASENIKNLFVMQDFAPGQGGDSLRYLQTKTKADIEATSKDV